MWRRGKTYRRIKRGKDYHEGPYWSMFIMGSLCAHAFFFAVAYGPLLSFITGLQKNEPVTAPFLYVTLNELKERITTTAARVAKPALRAEEDKKADDIKAVIPPETVTHDLKDSEQPVDLETGPPSSDGSHVADAGLLASPDKGEGITFIRGDNLSVEKFDEKENATEAKEMMNALSSPETGNNGRFSAYSTAKRAAILNYSIKRDKAETEVGVSSAARPVIGQEIPQPAVRGGSGRTDASSIRKEKSVPGNIQDAVSTVPAQRKELIAGKTPFSYASTGEPAESGPVIKDMSQKVTALPGRSFAAALNQVEPARARGIKSDKDEAPRQVHPAIRITSPASGPSEKKVVAVKGIVSGYGVVSVVLTFGKIQRELLVRGGEFESEVSLDPGRNLIRVDTSDASGETAADMVEVVYAEAVKPPEARMDLVVKVGYNVTGGTLTCTHRWAPHPLSKGSGQADAPEFKVEGGGNGSTVYVSKASPGIYTIGVTYDTTASGPVEATFDVTAFGYDKARRNLRKIGPVRLEGKGTARAVRLLLPECVLWEDDGWFTGVMESGRTTTKYKMPEGIVWKERD